MKKNIILLAVLLLSVSFSFAQEKKVQYTVKHLDECNNKLSNFGTTFYGEKQVIYASPKKGTPMIKRNWTPNEQPFLQLFIADIAEDGELVNSVKLNKEVNTKYHESNVVFTKDLQTVYFSRDKYYGNHLDKDSHGKTHIAMYRADVMSPTEWVNVVEMPFNNKDYCVGHPALSEDNKTLYYSSEMNGTDDIYKVSINGDGTYGTPINLGKQVNTAGSERFPFMGENNTLYFSSDKFGGLGKLDIYAVKLDGVSEPVNLGAPINSYKDDFSFSKKKGADYGYFSSNRSEGKGDDDIYYFKQNGELPCNQIVEGIVTDKNTGEKIPRALVIIYDDKGKELDSKVVGTDAKFAFNIDCKSKYKVVGTKELYSTDSKEFTSNANLKLGLDLELNLGKQDAPTPITKLQGTPAPKIVSAEYLACQNALDNINNIYFDLDKSYIRPDAASELDKVVKIMQRCENFDVIASSHTDCRASHKYNESLSQRRAQATVDYIVGIGGVSSNRIKAIGYGETRLRNKCADGVPCSEVEHQTNRRTQFDISNY